LRTRVRDQDVDAAEQLVHPRERARDRVGVGHVAEQPGVLDVAVGDRRHDGALLAKAAHGRLADAARPARHDDAFALEALHGNESMIGS
jgi:hypothetical protein